jgi:hypothetical protein
MGVLLRGILSRGTVERGSSERVLVKYAWLQHPEFNKINNSSVYPSTYIEGIRIMLNTSFFWQIIMHFKC